MACDYQALSADPGPLIRRLCEFADLELDPALEDRLNSPLPLSRYTHTKPADEKWRKNEREILSVLDSVGEVQARCEAVVGAKFS
jgi:hypothetical protein